MIGLAALKLLRAPPLPSLPTSPLSPLVSSVRFLPVHGDVGPLVLDWASKIVDCYRGAIGVGGSDGGVKMQARPFDATLDRLRRRSSGIRL